MLNASLCLPLRPSIPGRPLAPGCPEGPGKPCKVKIGNNIICVDCDVIISSKASNNRKILMPKLASTVPKKQLYYVYYKSLAKAQRAPKL